MRRTRMWAAGLAAVLVAGSVATPAIGAVELQAGDSAASTLEQEATPAGAVVEPEDDQPVPEPESPDASEPQAPEEEPDPAPTEEPAADPEPEPSDEPTEDTVPEHEPAEPEPTDQPEAPTEEEPESDDGDGPPKHVGDGPDKGEEPAEDDLPGYTWEASLPVTPTFKDRPGTAEDTITIEPPHGLDYQVLVDGEWVTIYNAIWRVEDFLEYTDGKALIQMRAVVAEDFATQPEWDEHRSEWAKVFTDADELTTVDFVTPTVHDAPGFANDVVIIPDTSGLRYYVGTGNEVAEPGAYNVGHLYNGDPEWIVYWVPVRVETLPGYTLDRDDDGRDLRIAFNGSENVEDHGEARLVEFVAPTLIDKDGTAEDAVVIPDTEGLQYQIGHLGNVPAGTYLIGDRADVDQDEDRYSVNVSAEVLPGYYFDGAPAQGFEARFTKELVADLPNVSTLDNPGTETDYLILGEARGISYVIDGEEWQPGTYPVPEAAYVGDYGASAWYTIRVVVQEGYDIPGIYSYEPGMHDAFAQFRRDLPTTEPADPDEEEPGQPDEGDDELVVIELPAVERIVIDGAEGYALPQFSGGFDWFVNGTDVATLAEHGWANFVPAPGSGFAVAATGGLYQVTTETLEVDSIDDIVIAARAHDGYTLLIGGGEPSETVYVHDSRQDAEIAAPTVNDGPGREDSYTVPDVPGLVFLDIDENVIAPGTYPVTAEYVDGVASEWLFATALPGYRLTFGGEVGDSWPGEAAILHIELTFTDVPGPADGDDGESDGDGQPGTPDTDDGENGGGTTPVVITPVDDSDEDTAPTGGKPADADDSSGAAKTGETTKLADTGAGQAGALAAVSTGLILAAWMVLRGRRDQVI